MMPKVYCKYCYSYTRLVPGDGIYECANCGAGLAPIDEIKLHGSYSRFQECITACYAVMMEAIELKKIKGEKVDEMSLYHKCPHVNRNNRGLYGLPLIEELRKSLGLPPLTERARVTFKR